MREIWPDPASSVAMAAACSTKRETAYGVRKVVPLMVSTAFARRGGGGFDGEVRQVGVKARQVCDASEETRNVEKQFGSSRDQSKAGDCDRLERSPEQGRQGAAKGIAQAFAWPEEEVLMN